MTFCVHWQHRVSWLTKLGHANRAPQRPACLSGWTHLSDCDMLLILTFIPPLFILRSTESISPHVQLSQAFRLPISNSPEGSSTNMADVWLPCSRMLHMCEAKLLGLNFVVFYNLTSSCFIFHYSSKCSSLGLGNTARLMLLSHWRCPACYPLLASPTTTHLQTATPALLTLPCPTSASTQESNFLLSWISCYLGCAYLCPLMLLWAPRKASLAEGRPAP